MYYRVGFELNTFEYIKSTFIFTAMLWEEGLNQKIDSLGHYDLSSPISCFLL